MRSRIEAVVVSECCHRLGHSLGSVRSGAEATRIFRCGILQSLRRCPILTRRAICAVVLLAWLCVFAGCNAFNSADFERGQSATKTSSTRASNCPAPGSPGVAVCAPPSFTGFATPIASPMQLIASATASQGRVIRMEELVDGGKTAQVHGDVFNEPVNVPNGSHTLIVVARETGNGSVNSAPINIQIEGSTAGEACPSPSSPGVNVCEPGIFNGVTGCHTSPWSTFVASGTAQTGTVRRMELWLDGAILAAFPGNSLNTNLYVNDFSTVVIKVVDSNGKTIESPPLLIQAC